MSVKNKSIIITMYATSPTVHLQHIIFLTFNACSVSALWEYDKCHQKEKNTKYLIVIRTKKRKRQKRKDHNKQGKKGQKNLRERKERPVTKHISDRRQTRRLFLYKPWTRREYTKIDVSVRK